MEALKNTLIIYSKMVMIVIRRWSIFSKRHKNGGLECRLVRVQGLEEIERDEIEIPSNDDYILLLYLKVVKSIEGNSERIWLSERSISE
jgi:hypothetical protein